MAFLIGIAGASGSGKTTIAEQVVERTDCIGTLLEMDHYYRDRSGLSYEERCEIDFDNPDSMELGLVGEHLHLLKRSEDIDRPIYDFKTHSRLPKTGLVIPGDYVIVEGIFALHKELCDMYDYRIFVNTPLEECAVRRLRRDLTERGRDVTEVCDRLENTVFPGYRAYVAPTMKYAHAIVDWSGNKDAFVNGIVLMLRGMNFSK